MNRIVLTGGPGAGKTVLARALAAEMPERLVCVPEAATQVYHLLDTRWDRLDVEGRRDVQRRIYRLQVQQELEMAQAYPGRALLLDRGTIDGSSYWPDGPADYWRDLGTTHEAELARYDAVIWLQSTAAIGLYDGDGSNEKRFETAEMAVEAGDRLLSLWVGHPRVCRVSAAMSLTQKMDAVRRVLRELLNSPASVL